MPPPSHVARSAAVRSRAREQHLAALGDGQPVEAGDARAGGVQGVLLRHVANCRFRQVKSVRAIPVRIVEQVQYAKRDVPRTHAELLGRLGIGQEGDADVAAARARRFRRAAHLGGEHRGVRQHAASRSGRRRPAPASPCRAVRRGDRRDRSRRVARRQPRSKSGTASAIGARSRRCRAGSPPRRRCTAADSRRSSWACPSRRRPSRAPASGGRRRIAGGADGAAACKWSIPP